MVRHALKILQQMLQDFYLLIIYLLFYFSWLNGGLSYDEFTTV